MISLSMPPRDLVSRQTQMLRAQIGRSTLDLPSSQFFEKLLESDGKFGFIVMDGTGTLFGTVCGNTREVLHKFPWNLSEWSGEGSQGVLPQLAKPYARFRMESRRQHVRKSAELATRFYINPATSQPNVTGLVLAGSAEFKKELSQSYMLDPRLQAKVLVELGLVDGVYVRSDAFLQAILMSREFLPIHKVILERRLIWRFFDEVSLDTGKYVYGVDDTLKALEMGALETLIVCQSLETNRYVLKNPVTGELVTKHLSGEQEVDQSNFGDAETEAELEVQEKLSLVEWLANEYKRFGCTLKFVTNHLSTQEGKQFHKNFGGIGGISRYKLDLHPFDEVSYDEYGEYSDSDD